jgi:hypothetical protein
MKEVREQVVFDSQCWRCSNDVPLCSEGRCVYDVPRSHQECTEVTEINNCTHLQTAGSTLPHPLSRHCT